MFKRRDESKKPLKPAVTQDNKKDLVSQSANANIENLYNVLQTVIDSSDAPIFSVGRDYCYTSFNKSHALVMKSLYGVDIQPGMSLLDYMTVKKDCKQAKKNIDRVLSKGETFIEEAYSGDELLSRRYFEISHGPIINPAGDVDGVSVMARDITQRRQIEEKLQRQAHDLGERVKELTCLYSLSRLIEKKDSSLEDIFKGAVALIPDAWQYPVITCARLIVEDKEYATSNWRDTVWKQAADIHVHGAPLGSIEICYLEQMPNIYEGPFLKEERDLINAIVERLGHVIERMQVAESLYLSEQKYRNIFENAIEGIFQSTPEGRYISVNPAFARIGGYNSPDEMINTVSDIQGQMYVHQDDRLRLVELLKNQNAVNNFEVEIKRKDGILIWISINVKLVEDRTGKTKYLEGAVIDITERKQSEISLKESEEKYRSLFNKAPVGIAISTIGGTVVDLNDAQAEMIGYTVEELRGKSVNEYYVNPDKRREMVEKFQKDGILRDFEMQLKRRDGSVITELLNFDQVQIGGSGFILVTGRDITGLRKSEKALQDSEAQYHLLSEHTTDTVWLMDMNLKMTYHSPSGEKMRGLTSQEIMEMPLEQHVTPESLELVAELFLKEIPRAESDPNYNPVRTLDLEYYRKDGTTVWAESKFSIIRDDSGKAVSILGEGRDITDRKLSEEKLVKSYESLKKTLNDAINTMVKIVEMRDPYTAGHQEKVADLATAIAREMNLEDTRIYNLRMAAVVHDIGKMYVPSDILSKPGKLSDIEFSLIKTHPQYGYDIVKSMDFPCSVANTVLQHHERLNGSGYPNGLKSEDTLMEAKILVVADVVEAMAANRPYRPALGIDKALEEISKNKGKLYDPDVVDACMGLFRSGRFKFKSV